MGQNMVSMGVDVNQNIYMQLQLLSEEYTFWYSSHTFVVTPSGYKSNFKVAEKLTDYQVNR
jgi:hypothetical protein